MLIPVGCDTQLRSRRRYGHSAMVVWMHQRFRVDKPSLRFAGSSTCGPQANQSRGEVILPIRSRTPPHFDFAARFLAYNRPQVFH